MKPPVPGWKAVKVMQPVYIPTLTGDGIAETIEVELDAWKDPTSGEVFLDGHATAKLDAAKARYLGLLTPDQLHELRRSMGVTQKGMAELLQLGEKTWTRWESGNERPSRSMNVLLRALHDGKLDARYLRSLSNPVKANKMSKVAEP